MAKRQDIVCRGDSFDDGDSVNSWRQEWCDKTANGRRPGEFIRKLDKKGQSWCSLCEKEVSYANRGYSALSAHVNRTIHKETLKLRQENQTLRGSRSNVFRSLGNSVDNDKGYGVHPFIAISFLDLTEENRRVPVDDTDRAKNQEAMILSFIAENKLPLSIFTPFLGVAEELTKDPEAFRRVCLDHTTASYKMKYGSAKTIKDDLLEALRKCKVSLNID
ncbi:hypothetical protein PoB_006294400 [Plakobranchus ocellatus]|uniref:Uncharacterized protein n=1 Tax=Plakobranchus ocellatus TaxID=259542 RepID=A0AAV4CX10_9GAST|nr:hypothetical protein PoB_006294400 [Plakobranchus ocellatus]